MLTITDLASDKHSGLSERGQRRLAGNTKADRKGRSSSAVIPTIYGTPFADLNTVIGNEEKLLIQQGRELCILVVVYFAILSVSRLYSIEWHDDMNDEFIRFWKQAIIT